MKTLLMCVQKDVAKYVEMIAAVFDVQVDCADSKKIRVAGTGRYSETVGKPLQSGKVYSRVMFTGETIFVKNASEDPICKGCINQPQCKDMCEVCYPIRLDGEVLGAICITSSNQQEYRTIVDNLDRLNLFMTNITDFIALKAGEYKDLRIKKYNSNLQEKLINLIRAGVMIIDHKGLIIYMNKYCENVIGYGAKSIPYLMKIRRFTIRLSHSQESGEAEYIIKVHSKQILLQGIITKIEAIEDNEKNTVFTFNEIKATSEDLIEELPSEDYTFSRMIGKSKVFLDMIELCQKEALVNGAVLLQGENGTQKDVLAKMIHNESIRYANRFISISHHTSMEKYLDKNVTDGLLDGTTLYIGEIEYLSLGNQRILLEIINKSEFTNTKVICSAEKDLRITLKKGNFYPELFDTLEDNVIYIPSLRTRGKDISVFAEYYLNKYNLRYNKQLHFRKDFISLMMNYSWKGNIQELKNMISYIVEQADKEMTEISVATVPDFILQKFKNDKKETYNLAKVEKELILKALNDFGLQSRSKTRVVRELGISSATLYRKLKQYGIQENTIFE